jgi:hypothetical protein
MSTRTPAVILSAAALVAASTDPVAVATDACAQPAGEMTCPVDPAPPLHTPDSEPEQGYRERISAEQAPPPRRYVLDAQPLQYGYTLGNAVLGLQKGTTAINAA